MISDKKALVNISSISKSKDPNHETFRVLYRELLLMNVSKIVCGILLVLLWFRIISKTIKTHGYAITSICSEPCQTSKIECFAKIAGSK